MTKLKPWARGPFELIRHAEGHLKTGSDFDKRMALISFDNATEAAIAAFLKLHPKQRDGKEYKKEQVAAWQANFHSKLDFLYDHYLVVEGLEPKISRDEVIWYHDLRNQLYHSGNGMVPEEQSLSDAREAAIWVLSVLLSVDAESLLTREVPEPQPISQEPSPQMRFLEAYIDLEKVMTSTLTRIGALSPGRGHFEARIIWDKLGRGVGDQTHWGKLFDRVRVPRNEIVHGKVTTLSDRELNVLTQEMKAAAHTISTLYPQP